MKAEGRSSWRRTCAELRRCASPGGRAELGATVAEGYRLVERALRAGARLRRALAARTLLERPTERAARLLEDLERAGVPVDVAPDEEMAELSEGRDLGRVAALVELPVEPPLGELAKASATLLVAAGVRDPGNLGAIVRTAHALAAGGLVAVGASELFHPRAVRTSLGSCFKLPLVQRTEAEEVRAELAAAGVRCVGSLAQGGSPPGAEVLGGERVALWVGAESLGLGGDVARRLDALVSLPMAEGVDSLSVHVAAALLLQERRQLLNPAGGS